MAGITCKYCDAPVYWQKTPHGWQCIEASEGSLPDWQITQIPHACEEFKAYCKAERLQNEINEREKQELIQKDRENRGYL